MNQAAAHIRTFTHEDVTYRFAMPSAEKQRAVMYRLSRYGLEPLISGLARAEVGMGSTITVMLGMVSGLFARIPEDDFTFICDTMTAKLFMDGSDKPITLEYFSGRMRTYMHVVALTLGSTFEDFTGLLTLFQSSTGSPGEAEGSQESASTQPSTGTSGDPA